MKRSLAVLAAALALVAAVGGLDYLTGFELSVSILYFVPVFLAGRYAGRWWGAGVSLAGAAVWLWADVAAGHVYSSPAVPYVNALVRLGFFLIFSLTMTRLQESLAVARRLVRTDSLTKLPNSRRFLEMLDLEIRRSRRYSHPFTVAYMDIDNFKEVNDTMGHNAGDRMLRLTARTIRDNVRAVDVPARLGGDEFGVLFVQTGLKPARVTAMKLKNRLTEVMRAEGYPVTFSVGVVSFVTPPSSVDEAMKRADDSMSRVKREGKNMVGWDVYGDQQEKVLAK